MQDSLGHTAVPVTWFLISPFPFFLLKFILFWGQCRVRGQMQREREEEFNVIKVHDVKDSKYKEWKMWQGYWSVTLHSWYLLAGLWAGKDSVFLKGLVTGSLLMLLWVHRQHSLDLTLLLFLSCLIFSYFFFFWGGHKVEMGGSGSGVMGNWM